MGKVVVNVHKLLSRANQDVLQAFTIAGEGDLGQVPPRLWPHAPCHTRKAAWARPHLPPA